MKLDVSKLIRKCIQEMAPYSCARSEFDGEARIYLDANENAYGAVLAGLPNRYPDPQSTNLRNKFAAIKGLQAENIIAGNGSDEIIDLLVRTTCNPGKDAVLIMPPTFGMYEVAAHASDIAVKIVNLKSDFTIDLEAVKKALTPELKIIFLCSPNNPSGNCIPADVILDLLNSFQGIVVVDEAYVDFVPETSAVQLLKEHNNLFVLQTLSKAWGLAGIRLGFGMADPQLIAALNKVKLPYNINQMTQSAASEALDRVELMRARVALLNAERTRVIEELESLACVEKIFPSQANFVLARFKDVKAAYQTLLTKGIVVRSRDSATGCKGCLRLTIGLPAENDELLAALAELGDE